LVGADREVARLSSAPPASPSVTLIKPESSALRQIIGKRLERRIHHAASQTLAATPLDGLTVADF
jgi:hypothetical protein